MNKVSELTSLSPATDSIFSAHKAAPLSPRKPNSQSFPFSQNSQQDTHIRPAPAFRNSSFMTPRKGEAADLDFSSGAENPSSPEPADDDTPDSKPTYQETLRSTPAKEGIKHPLFGLYTKFGQGTTTSSPGRGEVPRGHYSTALAKKVHKRRRRDLDTQKNRQLAFRRPSVESESEEDEMPPNSSGGGAAAPMPVEMGLIPSLFTFLERHPTIPHILVDYTQTIFNLLFGLFICYLVYCVWSTIRADVDRAAAEAMAEIVADMATCAKSYVENRCGGDGRVPALEVVCENWERCMNQDPERVGRARVSAATFAGICSSFIDHISYKTMVSLSCP